MHNTRLYCEMATENTDVTLMEEEREGEGEEEVKVNGEEVQSSNPFADSTYLDPVDNELHCIICKLKADFCNCCLFCIQNENFCTCCRDCYKIGSECICCDVCRGVKADCNCHLCDFCGSPLTESCECERKELKKEAENYAIKYWFGSHTRPSSNNPNL